ncbi:hypothetical protein ABRT01_14040 [Lentibacillus sp. L22]|uniref:hypothetical protein n=1 Tax=Lentibacillus TaxID=175304 RepID=UPI0022B14A7B|nr:hypothetical protein [Lentibacillus daqui]
MAEVLALFTTATNLTIAVINLTVVILSNRKKEKDFQSACDRRKSLKTKTRRGLIFSPP